MASKFISKTRQFLGRGSKGQAESEESGRQKTSDDTCFNSDATLIQDAGVDDYNAKYDSKHKPSRASGRKRKSEDGVVIIPENAKRIRSKNKTTSSRRGSPWDKPTRKKIDIKDLDLKRSYVEFLKDEATEVRPRRRTRYKYAGSTPLTDVERIPEGWSTEEPDLDPEDIDAQIVRCKERIDDNIMTFIFEKRLDDLERAKADIELRDGKEREGLDKNVYKRLEALRFIEKNLKEKGDNHNQLVNVYAILRAYRTKKLTWNRLVTYWSKGKQLCEPRPFDMDEFEAINEAHSGYESFWVEGFLGPGPSRNLASIELYGPPETDFTYHYNMAVRIPGVDWWSDLQFVHDTGASCMTLYQEDIDTMLGPFHPGVMGQPIPQLPVLGTAVCAAWNDSSNTYNLYRLEVAVLDKHKRRITPWARVPCILNPGRAPVNTDDTNRLDGPLLHYLLYVFSTPDNTGKITAATSRARYALANSVPENERRVDFGNATYVDTIKKATGDRLARAYRDMQDIHQKEFNRVDNLN